MHAYAFVHVLTHTQTHTYKQADQHDRDDLLVPLTRHTVPVVCPAWEALPLSEDGAAASLDPWAGRPLVLAESTNNRFFVRQPDDEWSSLRILAQYTERITGMQQTGNVRSRAPYAQRLHTAHACMRRTRCGVAEC